MSPSSSPGTSGPPTPWRSSPAHSPPRRSSTPTRTRSHRRGNMSTPASSRPTPPNSSCRPPIWEGPWPWVRRSCRAWGASSGPTRPRARPGPAGLRAGRSGRPSPRGAVPPPAPPSGLPVRHRTRRRSRHGALERRGEAAVVIPGPTWGTLPRPAPVRRRAEHHDHHSLSRRAAVHANLHRVDRCHPGHREGRLRTGRQRLGAARDPDADRATGPAGRRRGGPGRPPVQLVRSSTTPPPSWRPGTCSCF